MTQLDRIDRDTEGYVIDPEDWSEQLARELAAEEGLELTAESWAVICFMQAYWREHLVAPDVRHVVKHLMDAWGHDKRVAKQRLFELFPYGYVKQACKIAGMQRPCAWSTG